MARKHDTKAVRDAIEAMEFAEVGPKEMLRRLQEDDCGLEYPVDIGIRSVQYHLQAIRQKRARNTTQRDTLVGSIGAAKQEAADLLADELAAIRAQGRGKITVNQIAAVERIHRAAGNMEKAERKSVARPSLAGSTNGNGDSSPQPETQLEQLAREEAQADRPAPPDTPSQ